MKNIYSIIAALLFVSLAGCQKGPYPYVSKDVIDKLNTGRHPAIQNVAFIYNQEVYYLADFDSKPVQITETGYVKKFIKMSHDHTKFAYQTSDGIVEVVDKTGKLLTTLDQYTDVRNLDWSADDKTLYIVNADNIVFYGPAIKVPEILFYPGYYDFISAAVSKDGDLVYLLRKQNFSGADQYEMVIRKAAGGDPVFYRPDDFNLPMKYINFAANGVDMVLCFAELNTGDDVSAVQLFDNLNDYPALKFDNINISTPAYKSDIKYLLGGLNDETGKHLIRAIYLDNDIDNNNKVFPGYADIKYLDWK